MMFPVMPEVLDKAWPHVEPLLRPAIRRGDEFTSEQVLAQIQAGTSQLWVAVEGDAVKAAAVTELQHTPRRKLCAVWLCGGEGPWDQYSQVIIDWAREQGCKAVYLKGRKGWLRTLRKWRLVSVEMEYAL